MAAALAFTMGVLAASLDDTTMPWPSVLKTDDVSDFPTWELRCVGPDADGDGVLDRRDLCPGTVLPDVPTKG